MTNVLRSPYPGLAPPPVIITSGLIWGLAFDEGTGQLLNDLSPNNYDAHLGTTTGADTNDPNWITAGLDFDPAALDVVIAETVPDTNWLGAITVMVVAKVDAVGGTFAHFLCKHTGSGLTNVPIELRSDTATPPKLTAVRGNAAGAFTWTGPSMTLTTFQCYSVTHDGLLSSLPTFYLNTTASTGTGSVGTAVPPTGTGANIRLGRRTNATVQLDGTLSYVLVYNRILSAGEISTNYDALKAIMAARGVTLP